MTAVTGAINEATRSEDLLARASAGDGETKATYRLESSRGKLDLVLEYDPANDCIAAVSLVPVRLEQPDIE